MGLSTAGLTRPLEGDGQLFCVSSGQISGIIAHAIPVSDVRMG